MAASEKSINDILGSPDDLKFRSSMTLFDAVSEHEIFAEAIGTFYPDGKDSMTPTCVYPIFFRHFLNSHTSIALS